MTTYYAGWDENLDDSDEDNDTAMEDLPPFQAPYKPTYETTITARTYPWRQRDFITSNYQKAAIDSWLERTGETFKHNATMAQLLARQERVQLQNIALQGAIERRQHEYGVTERMLVHTRGY